MTVIIAYLMKRLQMSLSQAFSLVKSKRPQVAPNSGFMAQLRDYEKSLGGNSAFAYSFCGLKQFFPFMFYSMPFFTHSYITLKAVIF